MTPTIQLQLGPSYQDDQHLRDTLLNACVGEKWADRLAIMLKTSLLGAQESWQELLMPK